MAGGYDEIPTNLFLKHHHLADIEYKEKKEEENELNIIKDINKALLLTEGWHSEIVITTFVQFFHSLITNCNTRSVYSWSICIQNSLVLHFGSSLARRVMTNSFVDTSNFKKV